MNLLDKLAQVLIIVVTGTRLQAVSGMPRGSAGRAAASRKGMTPDDLPVRALDRERRVPVSFW